MSAEKLKRILQDMPETGVSGFEGLAKRILELVLNEPLVLARSGDQSSGDAHNLRRNICVQAKRYGNAVPNAKLVEGDFDECIRSLPSTDIYVLAVTRNTAQLDDTLNAMREKSAVDVVVWDFMGDDSALAVLCVEYWAELQDFAVLKGLDADLNGWISVTCNTTWHKERLAQLQLEVRECTQTLAVIREAGRSYLRRRFQLSSGAAPLPLHRIQLSTAVDRLRYHAQAVEWWGSNQSRVRVLNAPEGYGKTWAAAQCAWAICEMEGTVVLWLDSLQWRDCNSIDAVLTEAVSRLGIGDAQKVGRFVRKLRQRWSGRTLIVLDGVSERNALPSAQKIIEDLILKHLGTCRLLLTTRPLDAACGFDSALWQGWSRVGVDPFDDAELSAALAQAGIPETELPERLRPVARIPRYFTTSLRLRDRLRRFDNISVALVLWTDLLDKINGLEPAVRDALGFTCEGDAAEVLVKLATSLPEAVAKGEAQDLLNRCFGGNYSKVRNYLKEIRIMEQAGVFEATLNRDHTTLGRALLLRQVVQTHSGLGIRQAADRLLETLEPLASEDGSAEALFVTLQLSTMQQGVSSACLSQQRASLLYAWSLNHNSNASEERLEFWCRYDPDAYPQFVTAFFEQLYSGSSQELVANPLAKLWQEGGTPATALEPHIRRWLLLVWFDGCSGDYISYHGHQLPIAKTDDQVRLASLAVSLLSLRLEPRMLADLALSLATEDLTWRQIQNHRMRFKSIYENIGILMRWHYTERVLPELERMACEHETDKLLLEGVRYLADALRLVEVPPTLRLPPPEPFPHYFGTPAIELIRQKRRVFGCLRSEQYPKERNFSYLAVRDDLPQLSDEDVESVCLAVKEISGKDGLRAGVGRTIEDDDMEAVWPWYAKFRATELAAVAGQLQLNALKRETREQTQPMFWFLSGVLPHLDDDQLTEWENLGSSVASHMKIVNKRLENYFGLSITEAALLLLPEKAVHRWILASAEDEARRYCMCFAPLMDLIPLLLPNSTRGLAADKCIELGDEALYSDQDPPTKLDYWCYIAGLTTERNEGLYLWAKRRLLQTPEGEKRNFSLLRLWLRCAPAGKLEADLGSSDAQKLFDKHALRAWALSGKLDFDPKLVAGTYDELMLRLPQGFVGGILALSGRNADLNRWGEELFAVAMKHVGKPPFARTSCVETHISLGTDRMVRGVSFEHALPNSHEWTSKANFWGVDSESPRLKDVGYQPRQQLLNEELNRWQLDEHQMEKWEHYELHTFGAWSALEAWSKSYPDEFLPRARAILIAINQSVAAQHHLGGFLHAVVCCLLPTAPKEAWRHFVLLNRGQLRLSVQSNYDIPEFFAVLWDLKQCNSSDHDSLRRYLFERSRNEFEVMVLSVAALANRAECYLMQIVNELLGHELARERALGVSILAWIGSEESASRLAEVAATDASRWVRSHAEWAKEVSLQEKSSRVFFRSLLHEADPYSVSAGLQVLKPALTPLARWWHADILKQEEDSGFTLTSKTRAIFVSFWYHWGSVHKSHIEVFGRKLDEFCRGERLDRLKTPKLAPWWNWD